MLLKSRPDNKRTPCCFDELYTTNVAYNSGDLLGQATFFPLMHLPYGRGIFQSINFLVRAKSLQTNTVYHGNGEDPHNMPFFVTTTAGSG